MGKLVPKKFITAPKKAGNWRDIENQKVVLFFLCLSIFCQGYDTFIIMQNNTVIFSRNWNLNIKRLENYLTLIIPWSEERIYIHEFRLRASTEQQKFHHSFTLGAPRSVLAAEFAEFQFGGNSPICLVLK